MVSELEVVVIGSLSDVGSFDFTDEVTRIKASMLYGDRVRVESPKVPALLGMEFARTRIVPRILKDDPTFVADGMGEVILAELEKRFESQGDSARHKWVLDGIREHGVGFLLDLPETFAEVAATKGQQLEELGPSAFQAMAPDAIRSQLRRKKPKDSSVFQKAADELAQLMESGVATLDTQPDRLNAIMTAEFEEIDAETGRLLDRIVELLVDPSAGSHPLFSSKARATVRELAQDGRLAGANFRNANRVEIANRLVGAIPNFPKAGVDELLDLRTRVAPHLARFRKAVSELEASLESDISSADFDSAVQELALLEVEPALESLRQALRENGAVPTLTRGLPLTAGSTLALGASMIAGIPDAAGLAAAAVGLSTAVAREIQHRFESDEKRRASQLFLLFDLGRALQD